MNLFAFLQKFLCQSLGGVKLQRYGNLFTFLQKFLGQSLGGVKLQCYMESYEPLCFSSKVFGSIIGRG